MVYLHALILPGSTLVDQYTFGLPAARPPTIVNKEIHGGSLLHLPSNGEFQAFRLDLFFSHALATRLSLNTNLILLGGAIKLGHARTHRFRSNR